MTVISLTGLFLACPSSSSSTTPPAEVNKTPAFDDYAINGVADIFVGGDFPTVTVTLKPGVDGSPATPVVKYNGKIEKPSTASAGGYAVTFDVPAATGWNAVSNFSAGVVNVKDTGLGTPIPEHFTVTGIPTTALTATVDPAPTITVTPINTTVSQGTPSIAYKNKGTNTTSPTLSTANSGTFDVVVTIPVSTGWNSLTFIAGTIYIKDKDSEVQVTPIGFADFNFNVGGDTFNALAPAVKEIVYTDDLLPVTVTGKTAAGLSYPTLASAVITYTQIDSGSGTYIVVGTPKNVGEYDVSVRIPAYVGANSAFNDLDVPLKLKIMQRTPVPTDFTIGNLKQAEAGKFQNTPYPVVAVTIVSKFASLDATTAANSGNPAITITYQGGTQANPIPQTAGTYAVTFDVDASTDGNWTAATGLSAGNLEVIPLDPVNLTFAAPFWFDNDVLTVSPKNNAITPGQSIVFTAPEGNNDVVQWMEDGKVVATSGRTYTFNKTAIGWHYVSLVVKANGKLYSDTAKIRVQTPQQ